MQIQVMEILRTANSKEDILDWGRGFCQIFEYEHGCNQVIVMLEDIGSGLTIQRIYIFGKPKDSQGWGLILYRPTATTVGVRQENGKLIFTNERTESKEVIFEQSLEVLWPVGEFPG